MAMLYVGPSAGQLSPVPLDPSSLSWGLQDISSSDAGRVQDAGNTMYKMRTSQKRKLSLSWSQPTDQQAAEILQMFNSEYFLVRYWDVMDGAWEVRTFYAGDRTAPFQWFQIPGKQTRYTTLSFDIIER